MSVNTVQNLSGHQAAPPDITARPAVIATLDGQPAGLASYPARGVDWELVTIATDPNRPGNRQDVDPSG